MTSRVSMLVRPASFKSDVNDSNSTNLCQPRGRFLSGMIDPNCLMRFSNRSDCGWNAVSPNADRHSQPPRGAARQGTAPAVAALGDEKSVVWWGNAANRSSAHSAIAEAAAQLQKGLDQLVLLPDSSERQRQELELRSALGRALASVKGQAALETGHAFARARELW